MQVVAALSVGAQLECLSELERWVVFDLKTTNDHNQKRSTNCARLEIVFIELILDLCERMLLKSRPSTRASR